VTTNTKNALDQRQPTADRRARREATVTPEKPVPRVRSGRQRIALAFSPELEFLLARWQKKGAALTTNRDAYGRALLSWLITRNALVTASAHRRALDAQRADLAGDAQMLATVERIKEGMIRLELSDGRKPIGAMELVPGVLPQDTKPGDRLLLTFSRPCCRECKRTDRAWVKPDLCSVCARQQKRRRA
jgi:hypothetical protein